MALRQESEGKPALSPRPTYPLVMIYSFTDNVSEKETWEEKLQEWKYDRISWEGIKLDEDSLAAENENRQDVFNIHFICLIFKLKPSDYNVKYTADTAVSTLRVKKKK